MLLLNLDRFRILNEGFGHDIGDRVLVSIAQVIRSLVRDVDILARYSGEEFAIILPEMGIAELRAVGERIRLAIEQQVHAMHRERIGVQTTISLGGAMIPPRDSCAQQLIALAKQALEEAKQGGRNQLQILDATRIAGATPR
jgi:two-component system cell cycle response regulator